MSRRTEKVDQLLEQEIGALLVRDFEAPDGCLITVSKVEVTPDLKHAIVFVSVLPENKSGSALAALRREAGRIQHDLNRRVHMKFVPRIEWEFDDINVKLSAVDEALNESKPSQD